MMEADLVAVLNGLCPQVFPDEAPAGTLPPFITYQAIGGQALRHTDNTPAGLRHTLMQLSVWTSSRLATLQLIQQAEEALCAAAAFTARPAAEPTSQADGGLGWYGSLQDYDIWAPRSP